jgi:hypothetical protein
VHARPLRDQLLRLELALARRDPTAIEGGLEDLLDPDFREFGASGGEWTRDTVRDLLTGPATDLAIEDFEVAELGDGVALATYRTSGPLRVNRSSVWIRREEGWRLRFHQGTRAVG